jgi:acetyltransferase
MGKLLGYLRARGTREVVGQCLQENAVMASLARSAGFRLREAPEGIVTLQLALAGSTRATAEYDERAGHLSG